MICIERVLINFLLIKNTFVNLILKRVRLEQKFKTRFKCTDIDCHYLFVICKSNNEKKKFIFTNKKKCEKIRLLHRSKINRRHNKKIHYTDS